MGSKKAVRARASGTMGMVVEASDHWVIDRTAGVLFEVRPDGVGPDGSGASHFGPPVRLSPETILAIEADIEAPIPDYRFSPAARALLVEAHERGPLGLLVEVVVVRGQSIGADRAEAAASLADQGLLTLVRTYGRMVSGGYSTRTEWKLTPKGLEVARVVGAS
jgi:hypothetical protein